MTALSGDATSASVKRANELLDRLPPGRAEAMHGVLLVLEAPSVHRGEAMKRLRQAYAEAPDDPDVAALYAAIAIGVGATDEGFSVVDRVASRYPTRSALAINNALLNATQRDPARGRRADVAFRRSLQ